MNKLAKYAFTTMSVILIVFSTFWATHLLLESRDPKKDDHQTSLEDVFDQFNKIIEQQFNSILNQNNTNQPLTKKQTQHLSNGKQHQIIVIIDQNGNPTNIVPNNQTPLNGQGLPPQGQPNINNNQNFPFGNFTFGQQAPQQEEVKRVVEKPKERFSDVRGQAEALQEATKFVKYLKYPEKYQSVGATIPKGILLKGAPGNGKTLMARAIAGEAECNFIAAHGSQFINKYVGTGAAEIRRLFADAREQTEKNGLPTIIFLDEIDALGSRQRDENQEYRHTINELLVQMDGFHQDPKLIIIAATNFPESLDPALTRNGRIDRSIEVPKPNKKGRIDVLTYYFNKISMDSTIDKEKLATGFATRTSGFSCVDLKDLTNRAAELAGDNNDATVKESYFETAYDAIVLGMRNNMDRTKKQLLQTAIHEAGHVIINLLTEQPVAKASILSKGGALGATFNKEKYETAADYSKEELIARIMSLQGGCVAEKLLGYGSNPGASSDLSRVNQIASQMIKQYGMGEGDLEGITANEMISDTMKLKFDNALLALIKQCRKQTTETLTKNKDLLVKMADKLFEKETLTEKEIYEIAQIKPLVTAA